MAVQYIKSSFCPAGACVEVALMPNGEVAVRDGKNPDKDPHVFTTAEWAAFINGVKNREFDFDIVGG